MIAVLGPPASDAVSAPTPTGAAFDLVLLAHIVVALVAFGVVAVSAVQAVRLGRAGRGPLPANLVRYYAPGVNWVGRSLHLVPVLGVALVAMSRRAYGYDDLWVQLGLGLWLAAALAAEGVLWPAERRLQRQVATDEPAPPPRHVTEVVLAAVGVEVALLVATVVMVAKP